MATSFEIFQALFKRWERENFSLTFYFEKIFDKVLSKLIENTESALVEEIQSEKYKGLFCPVGYSIENIALIAALIKPKFLNDILGKTAKRDIEEDQWITWEDIEK